MNLLKKLGLSDRSATVYLTLLQHPASTMTEIAKAADMKRPTMYLVIDDLLKRGLISVERKGRTNYYSAEHPQKLMQMVKATEHELSQSLPELEALYNEPKDKPRIKVYEGVTALETIYDDLYTHLSNREEALFFTSMNDLQLYFPQAVNGFMKQIRKRDDYRIRELIVNDEGGIAYVKKMQGVCGQNHYIRLFQKGHAFHDTDNLIFGNKLVIFSIKKDLFVIVIEHKNIADTYRALFNAAWEMGEAL